MRLSLTALAITLLPTMAYKILCCLALLILALPVAAQSGANNPRVLLDTDRGPLLLELDAARTPITTTNYLRYVDAGRFDGTLLSRVVNNFVVQGGGLRENGTSITRFPAIVSERPTSLNNERGTIAMALSGNPPNVNSASSDFFINTRTNATLDTSFTAFGRVIFGLGTLEDINNTPLFFNSEQPIRSPLIKNAVRIEPNAFPILSLHSGTWFDPNNSGKGFLIAVSQTAGNEAGPFMVVSWYDYADGQQIWVSGLAPFALGDTSVTVPLQITSGAQFGSAFNPDDVVLDAEWGSITLRFSGCDSGEFSYTTRLGDGVVPVRNLTSPTGTRCTDN